MRALLAVLLGAGCFAASAQGEDFSVGGFNLSSTVAETSDGEAWDAEANHRRWQITKTDEEPIQRYAIAISAGKLGERPTEGHQLGVYTTERRQAFLIDFKGSLNSLETTDSRDFLKSCLAEVALLGGATRSFEPPANLIGVTVSIVADRDLPSEAKVRTLAALDAWAAAWRLDTPSTKEAFFLRQNAASPYDLTKSLKFKKLAAALGRDFRGAIIACGHAGDLAPMPIWQTRFLDLPLAATVFNLDPE